MSFPSTSLPVAIRNAPLLDDGTRGELQVKKGDRILFTSYAPEPINIDGWLDLDRADRHHRSR